MCGIFGLTVKKGSVAKAADLRPVLTSLVRLSESRGKEAAGLAFFDDTSIAVRKAPVAGMELLKKDEVRKLLETGISDARIAASRAGVIGHTRLVTNGSLETHENNQPVIRGGIVGIHNGIIVNDAELFAKHGLKRHSEVDTEALLALIEASCAKGASLPDAVREAYREISGTASVALLFQDAPWLVLATNNGSLYHLAGAAAFVFASERHIMEEIIRQHGEALGATTAGITHLEPGSGLAVDLDTGQTTAFEFDGPVANGPYRGGIHLSLDDLRPAEAPPIRAFRNAPSPERINAYERIWDENAARIGTMKRCARCILPAAMPFIEFDAAGVCNWCRHHVPQRRRSEAELMEAADRVRGDGSSPDCLFPLSGGRDSSYGLHYVKNVLKLHPIAYSYDWGMLTDLGRRNQARMCGALGVEHLLVSADIPKKRRYIRDNVLAWLKDPDLGTIPLFMAGDKQYFWHLNRLREQTGVGLTVYSENPLEQTNFKYGFCGVPPKFDKEHVYDIGLAKKLKLASYYAGRFIRNPGFLNASLLDTIGAYFSTYFLPHDYLYLFNYIPWDEAKINETLIRDYDWELAPDTTTTWRIGDGTAAFYNYIYGTVAGFTENDTFRSNQVREGLLTREKALGLAREENRPRFDSIRWYCDTIGIDMYKAADAVNAMPKLY